MFWVVMFYWYFLLVKFWEFIEFVLVLTFKFVDADGLWVKVTSGSRKCFGCMLFDVVMLIYVGLNVVVVVFDNCYMVLYILFGFE